MKAWAAKVTFGVEYDDNVAVDQTDNRTNQSDHALVLNARGSYEFFQDTKSPVEVSYNYSKTKYTDLSAFNLDTHSVFVSTGRSVGDVDLGVVYAGSHTQLGGKAFLNLHNVTPTVGFAVTDTWYVSTAYTFQDKMFHSSSSRDGNVNAASIDTFLFTSDAKSHVKLGYRIEKENTRSDEFDYVGHYFNAGLKTPLTNDDNALVNLKLSYQYFFKDYENRTASIGSERLDKRHTVKAELSVPVLENADVTLGYKHVEGMSNLESADFTENTLNLAVGVDF